MAFMFRLPISPFSLFVLLALCTQSSVSVRVLHKEGTSGSLAPSCERIECPGYELVHEGNGFEIRRYDSPVWVTTSPIDDISFVNATREGFLQLFDYIQGKNKYGEKIEMTAPVITEVSPSDGPFCASSFATSFYVPAKNQADPPLADGLHLQRWKVQYAAVRRFGGFVSDYSIAEEAAALQASLAGSSWSEAIAKSRRITETKSLYTVAQYNSPFEFDHRVNEIWLLFDLEGSHVM